jgi:hypothetical protein
VRLIGGGRIQTALLLVVARLTIFSLSTAVLGGRELQFALC